MASTFTLKRKIYTEYDYRNDIATMGFQEGFNYAYERLFSVYSRIAEGVSKKFPTSSVFDHGDVKRILRGKSENIFGTKYSQDQINHVNSEFNRLNGGGKPTSSLKVHSGQPQLQQRAASFIGKGYLY